MQIFVKALTGKTFILDVEPSDSIDSIKNKINEKEGIPSIQQNLLFLKKQLKNEETIKDLNIRNESTLHLIVQIQKPIQIFIKPIKGETFTLDIQPFDQISLIKNQIYEKQGIQINKQRLIYSKKELQNEQTISNLNIKNQSIIHLILKQNYKMNIFIKTLVGRIIPLEVNSQDLIEDVKAQIQEKTGIPIEIQGLAFAGKILRDGKMLQEFNVQNESILFSFYKNLRI